MLNNKLELIFDLDRHCIVYRILAVFFFFFFFGGGGGGGGQGGLGGGGGGGGGGVEEQGGSQISTIFPVSINYLTNSSLLTLITLYSTFKHIIHTL